MWNEWVEDADPCQKWEKQMSSFGALPVPFRGRYVLRQKLKGCVKNKVPRCNQPSMFLESQSSHADR